MELIRTGCPPISGSSFHARDAARAERDRSSRDHAERVRKTETCDIHVILYRACRGPRHTTGPRPGRRHASAARGPRPRPCGLGHSTAAPLLDTAQGFDPYTAHFMETFIRLLATVRRSFIRTHKRNATRSMMACTREYALISRHNMRPPRHLR
jgi:hypothetical protein